MSGSLVRTREGSGAGDDLESRLWARHRRVRPAVALGAVVAASLASAHQRWLLAYVLVCFVPAAILAAATRRPPSALALRWWPILASDAGALGLALALVPGAEPAVLAGAVLVAVVNGTSFGGRAGVASAVVVGLAVLAGHAVGPAAHTASELVLHLGAFGVSVGLATYLVGRQAEDLRTSRARAELHAAELERVGRFRSRLVSVLAHDVRSPLTAIRGSASTLLRLRGRLAPDEEDDLLRGIDRQVSRLLRLATGLLDLARLEEGRLVLHPREIDLRAAVREALAAADPEGRIALAVESGIRVVVDPERIDQVLVNLATNCLRHGEPPFRVEAAREEGWVALSFVDAGPGVPPERRAELFEPFRNADARSSVGLGLWIVRMLVEAHGGSVTYEPNRPRGARFSVRLPVPTRFEGGRGAALSTAAGGDGSSRRSDPRR